MKEQEPQNQEEIKNEDKKEKEIKDKNNRYDIFELMDKYDLETL